MENSTYIIIGVVVVVISISIIFFVKNKETFIEIADNKTWTPNSEGETVVFTWSSPDSKFVHQADGNFVLYENGIVLWAANKFFYNVNVKFDATNGVLCLVNNNNEIVWKSTQQQPSSLSSKFQSPFRLVQSKLNQKPNVYIVDKNNYIIWMTTPYNKIFSSTNKNKTLYATALNTTYVDKKKMGSSIYYYSPPYLYSLSDTNSAVANIVVSGNSKLPLKHIPREFATSADVIYLRLSDDGTIVVVNNENYVLSNKDLKFTKKINFINDESFRFSGIKGWKFP